MKHILGRVVLVVKKQWVEAQAEFRQTATSKLSRMGDDPKQNHSHEESTRKAIVIGMARGQPH
jgi:hypothetical protein